MHGEQLTENGFVKVVKILGRIVLVITRRFYSPIPFTNLSFTYHPQYDREIVNPSEFSTFRLLKNNSLFPPTKPFCILLLAR